MTNVEKQMNKEDLEAYKNKKTEYNALIPGINNMKTVKLNAFGEVAPHHVGSLTQRENTRHATIDDKMARLDKYGYNRGYASLIN